LKAKKTSNGIVLKKNAYRITFEQIYICDKEMRIQPQEINKYMHILMNPWKLLYSCVFFNQQQIVVE